MGSGVSSTSSPSERDRFSNIGMRKSNAQAKPLLCNKLQAAGFQTTETADGQWIAINVKRLDSCLSSNRPARICN
jgi:hypothetical protein